VKTVFTAAAAALFAANVGAADFYHEFAQGNSDLFEGDGSLDP